MVNSVYNLFCHGRFDVNQQQRVLFIITLVVICSWLLQRRYIAFQTDFSRNTDHMELGYKPPFYEEWQRKHDVYPFDCWTDDGYDPSRSDIPRDIQLLAGMDYGKSDIDNGGFHQFFHNGTGVFAPEMVEWCERCGLNDVADVIRLAMKKLSGDAYPRSQEGRQRLLANFPVRGEREQWDPFYALDEKFYELLSNNGTRYDDAANKWLRETCGVTALDHKP
jgi:hypothetical protein